MKKLLLAAAAVCALAAPAHAFTLIGTQLSDVPTAYGAGTVLGYSYYDGPILLKTDLPINSNFESYCVDLNHFLQTGVSYHFGQLTTDGNGTPIAKVQSYAIGKIAIEGISNTNLPTPDQDLDAAAQLAIWAIEYGTSASGFKDAAIESDYNTFMGQYSNDIANIVNSHIIPSDYNWATAVIPDSPWPGGGEWGSSQMMVVGLETGGVPEPSTWAMGLIGFGVMAGLAAFNRRKAARYVEV